MICNKQVQMSAVSGDMAALGGHQPSLVQLKPGVVSHSNVSSIHLVWFVMLIECFNHVMYHVMCMSCE
jgi:predicted nuclease of predicted toxin-antitoxin system